MRKERGAIVVEATVALTAFIFMILTILSVVNVCYAQAKIAVSLNSAAKEISQYSYLYYVTGLNKLDQKSSDGTEGSVDLAKHTIDGVDTFMDALTTAGNSLESGDFDSLVSAVEQGKGTVDSLVTEYGDAIGDDPRGFVIGMGKMALSESKEVLKSQVFAKTLAKSFMKKNLRATPGDDPDAFLKRLHVVNGMDGLDFQYSTLMAHGKSNEIQLVVTYKVKLIQLLNLDFDFTIRQCSKTRAWGNGISKMNPQNNELPTEVKHNGENIWDMKDATNRGKVIVAKEKEKYDYTDSGAGFDAYDNQGGKNEFVTVISVDTHSKSYQTVSGLKGRISAAYNSLYGAVHGKGEEIKVTDKDGNETTIHSDPETRSYNIVMVIPDDADLSLVSQAVREFQQAHPGVKVTVRNGYGSPSAEEN